MSTGGKTVIIEAGASQLEETLVSGRGARRANKAAPKILGSTLKQTLASGDQVVASINTAKCVNCGVCRENCPADAIFENQRTICHVCPTCTELPGISVGKMKSLPTETSCTVGCPIGISPQGYLGLVKAGKPAQAYELIWSKNPLPSVCGRVCHHPCEDGCKRGILVDEPLKIRAMKHYLSDKVDWQPERYPRLYEERVAIIGAGPAGLTAGHYLASAGYDVTVFEGASEPGGMLLRGIPEFRLPREVIRGDIAKLREAGLDIRCNQKLNKTDLEDLGFEYDAVIVATGAPNSKELHIPGWRSAGVMTAMNFMEHVNNHQKLRRHLGQLFKFDGGKAVIIGGGSVAIDCARAAVRLGAAKVTVVCLEEGDAVPAHPWELTEAREEGVEIIEGFKPVEYQSELFPTLTGIKFEKVISLGKDEKGAFVVKSDKDNAMVVACDWCVEAIGQGRDPLWDGISAQGTFFAGDAASSACSVIDAIASGRETALKVDAGLRGRVLKDPLTKQKERLVAAPVGEKLFPYNFRKIVRPAAPMAPAKQRAGNFNPVEGAFSDEEAYREADCCLGCGYEAVDAEKCLGCGICVKLCPKGDVITMVAKEGGNTK